MQAYIETQSAILEEHRAYETPIPVQIRLRSKMSSLKSVLVDTSHVVLLVGSRGPMDSK
jgi:hypothetical protein